jgi:hypothetical protein
MGVETWSTIATDVSDGVEAGSVLFIDREALAPGVAYEYAVQAYGRDGFSNGAVLVLRRL